MAYIDLFSGPGRYDDQSKSTPLLVLETILTNADLTNWMVTLFNDKDKANIESQLMKQLHIQSQLSFLMRIMWKMQQASQRFSSNNLSNKASKFYTFWVAIGCEKYLKSCYPHSENRLAKPFLARPGGLFSSCAALGINSHNSISPLDEK